MLFRLFCCFAFLARFAASVHRLSCTCFFCFFGFCLCLLFLPRFPVPIAILRRATLFCVCCARPQPMYLAPRSAASPSPPRSHVLRLSCPFFCFASFLLCGLYCSFSSSNYSHSLSLRICQVLVQLQAPHTHGLVHFSSDHDREKKPVEKSGKILLFGHSLKFCKIATSTKKRGDPTARDGCSTQGALYRTMGRGGGHG